MRFRCLLALVAATLTTCAMSAAPASAAITLVNGGFETGTTAGWSGTGSAATGYAGYSAPSGTYFGLARSPGCPGQRLEQTFAAAAGDTLSGWAFFKTADYLPYDDNGDVKIIVTMSGSQTVLFSSSVSQVGDFGGTPWKPFSYTIPVAGSYSLQARVDNAGDCGVESAVGLDLVEAPPDTDLDGVRNAADNCPLVANADQVDADGDGQGDSCDPDDDNDTVADATDNCQFVANADQADNDGDTTGDVCDADDDNDTVADTADNCQYVANATQADNDGDGIGDACDADDDGDSIIDSEDNCPASANTTQLDTDGDHIGDACDPLTYQFAGFYSPVDNIPTVNTVKAGSSIPLKFTLGGNRGLAIFAGGAPASARIPCGSSDSIDAVEQIATPGSSGLTYDSATDRYQLTWKTDKSWAGTCRQLVVTTADGGVRRVNFQLK